MKENRKEEKKKARDLIVCACLFVCFWLCLILNVYNGIPNRKRERERISRTETREEIRKTVKCVRIARTDCGTGCSSERREIQGLFAFEKCTRDKYSTVDGISKEKRERESRKRKTTCLKDTHKSVIEKERFRFI